MTQPARLKRNAAAWASALICVALTACARASAIPSPPPALSPMPPSLTPLDPTPTIAPSPTIDFRVTTVGSSVSGRPIVAHRFGDGADIILLIGGLHGGYEWNTVLLAYALIDYLDENPADVPPRFAVIVIPSANPDGLYAVTGASGRFTPDDALSDTSLGRLNANDVDLNRNWGCNWRPEAHWGERIVSAGDEPFSEPETRALRDYIESVQPSVVILWHSAARGVFAGGCGTGSAFSEGKRLAGLYAEAAGYVDDGEDEPGADRFTAYPITGDAANWISSQGIPALVVELATHRQIEFEENWRGLQALFASLSP